MNQLMPIRTFIRTHLDDAPTVQESHSKQFDRAGYIPVYVDASEWKEIHAWLGKNYPNRYTWTGNIFWFDDAKIAVKFALRFS